MLKNVAPCISPDLLKALCAVGHGAKIMICDSNCSTHDMGNPYTIRVRADGVRGPELLKAILELIPLDDYIDDSVRICKTSGGRPNPAVWEKYEEVVKASEEYSKLPNGIVYMDGKDFWSVHQQLDLVIASGETDIYGNIFIQKGVIK